MRRPELADLMLLATVTLWALNFTVTKYVLSNGFQPIAYGVLRFGSAAVVFAAVTWWRERSFALGRRDLWILAGAALVGIFLNQLAFGYAIKLTTATTVALLFGTLPVMTGIFARLMGIERLGSRFWLAAALAFGGAALVALGSGGGVSGQLWGDLLGFAASATWAWYTVAVSPLLRMTPPRRLLALEPEHVLVGHGEGIHADATVALRDAVRLARRRTPSWAWAGLRAHGRFHQGTR